MKKTRRRKKTKVRKLEVRFKMFGNRVCPVCKKRKKQVAFFGVYDSLWSKYVFEMAACKICLGVLEKVEISKKQSDRNMSLLQGVKQMQGFFEKEIEEESHAIGEGSYIER